MKATDLMIGDWAQSEDLVKPARYSGIFGEYTPAGQPPYKRLRFLYEGGIEGSDVPESRVLPIPLTAEILEKNGFEYGESQAMRNFATQVTGGIIIRDDNWHTQYDEIVICEEGIKDNEEEYTIWHIENFTAIMYVHELQHALRLCGLNELADDFQV